MTPNAASVIFSFSLGRGECYPKELQCMAPNVANLLSLPFSKGEFNTTKLHCITANVANVFTFFHYQGVNLTQPNFSA